MGRSSKQQGYRGPTGDVFTQLLRDVASAGGAGFAIGTGDIPLTFVVGCGYALASGPKARRVNVSGLYCFS